MFSKIFDSNVNGIGIEISHDDSGTAAFIRAVAQRKVTASRMGLVWPPSSSVPGTPKTRQRPVRRREDVCLGKDFDGWRNVFHSQSSCWWCFFITKFVHIILATWTGSQDFAHQLFHQPTNSQAARHYRPTRFCYVLLSWPERYIYDVTRPGAEKLLGTCCRLLVSEVVRNFPGADAVALYTPQKLTTWNPSTAIFHMHNWVGKGGKIKLIHWRGVLMATRFPSWNSLVPSETAR